MNAITTRQSLGRGRWFNLASGIWLIVSPFVLSFERASARWNSIAVGVAVILLALLGGSRKSRFQALVVPLGVWLFMSPFVLGFSGKAFVANSIVMTFLIISGGAASDTLHDADLSGKWGSA